jgi:putative nucleotidyltransferase with HDIG domain
VTEAAGVGAYASVPVQLSDGQLYGTLCAASHDAAPGLGERDVQFLAVLARIVAGEIERDAALRAEHELRVQAAGAEALLSAIEARDRYTGVHSREVVGLAEAVAEELGLPAAERHAVTQVALLHDIGKLSVPDAILCKPGALTQEETQIMRRHPGDGARIVAAIPDLAHLAPAIGAEHERWDGQGYPQGLAGEDIPIASRIVFACDAWDAMTSDRPYRGRLPREQALAELRDNAGTQFCPRSVQALCAVLDRG